MGQILTDAELEVYADGSDAPGWIYSIASTSTGPLVVREQVDNPVFTRDYANNFFESGIVYRVLAYHPELLADRRLMRAVFDELGGVKILSPAESPTDTTVGGGSGNPGNSGGYINVTLPQLTDAAGATGQLAVIKKLLTAARFDTDVATLLCNMLSLVDCAGSGGGGGGSDSVAAAYAGCVNMPINNERIALASAEDNKLITHQLGTAEFAATFYRLVNGTYRPDPNVGVSNPTETTFNLYSPESPFTGLVKLTRADAL